MFAVATKMSGTSEAFPDTCNTPAPPGPPAPLPYPNSANLIQANPATCSKRVKVLNQPVLTMGSVVPMTAGDEAGSLGGVVSGMIKGPAQFTRGSTKVMVEGQPVAFQTCQMAHNGVSANAPIGIHASPSQTRVFVSG